MFLFRVVVLLGVASVPLLGQTIGVAVESPSIVVQSTTGQQPLQALVTLRLDQVSLIQALDTVAKLAKLRLSYTPEALPKEQRVTLNVIKKPAKDVFAEILETTPFEIRKVEGSNFVLVKRTDNNNSNPAAAQATGNIKGVVKDSATGRGIGGATVLVQGTTFRAETDADGNFSFTRIPIGEYRLTVKLLGYKSAAQTVTVKDGSTVSAQLVLSSVPTLLSGVVTTAAGKQNRMKVGNDITVLNVDSILNVAPVSSVTDLLATRVPGVIVQNTSGLPGAPSKIRFRGAGSITRSNDPIVIVDGIRVQSEYTKPISSSGAQVFSEAASPIDQIDPNSIETIEVFKGPSAAAIYGSDAGNGVIVITTKRGKSGPTRWRVAASKGINKLPGKWPLTYFRFGHTGNGSIAGLCRPYDGCIVDTIVAFQALNDKRYTVIGTGESQEGSISVEGGNSLLRYSVTASVADETGIVRLPEFEIERFRQRMGFIPPQWARKPAGYWRWGGNSIIEIVLGKNGGTLAFNSALFSSRQQQSPLQGAIRKLQGWYIDTTFFSRTSLFPDFYTRRNDDALTVRTSGSVNYPVRSWLPIRSDIGVSIANTQARSLTPRNFNPLQMMGAFSTNRKNNIATSINIGTTVQRSPNRRIPGISVPVGINLYIESSSGIAGDTYTLEPGENEPSLLENAFNNRTSAATFGWYIAPTIDLNSRFIINPGIRFDNGSASGSRSGIIPFPKLDFAWIAVDRPADPMFGVLTLLRPRLAYGIAGVQPEPGQYLRILESSSWRIPGQINSIDVLDIASMGNTHLRPERARELEGGFDAEFWNQRFTLSVSGYQKMRYDAIIRIPLAPSLGYWNAGYDGNIGTIRNRGIDIAAGLRIFDRPEFSWIVNTNVHQNSNTVMKLIGNISESALPNYVRLVEGYPLFGMWTRKIAGYADSNGDGLIHPSEVRFSDSLVYAGSSEPDYQLALSTSLSLWNGRLNINTAIEYQSGFTQVNAEGGYRSPIGESILNNPNTTLATQALIASNSLHSIQTVNTLRWSSLSIGMICPSWLTRRIGVSSMMISLQGSNLALKTNYYGQDPSVNGYGASDAGIIDAGQIPQPRLWQFRITLGN